MIKYTAWSVVWPVPGPNKKDKIEQKEDGLAGGGNLIALLKITT